MAKTDNISVSGRTATIKFSTGRMLKRTEAVTVKAMQQVGQEMERKLKAKISRPSPPRSRPGRPLRKESGRLHGSVTVVVRPRAKRLDFLMNDYGMFWDQGIPSKKAGGKVKRPWFTPVVIKQRRNWERKLNAAMKKFSK